METIELKNIKGKVLYSYTCENNNISKTLKQAVEENVYLNSVVLKDVTIENINLINLSLKGATLMNVVINNSSLEHSDLSDTKIFNSHFYNTSLAETNFSFASIINDTFTDCYLSSAIFNDSFLQDVNFKGKIYLYNTSFLKIRYGRINLYDKGVVKNSHDVAYIGNIGSRNSYTNVFNTDKGIFVSCGCFFGTLEEFEKEVLITHKYYPQYKKEYLDMIEYIKKRFNYKSKFSWKSIIPFIK